MKSLAIVLLAALALGQAPAPGPSADARQAPAVPVWQRRPELRAQLQRDLETLKRRLPLQSSVTLKFQKLLSGMWGYCAPLSNGGYLIVVAEAALDHEVLARETLVHEYAHAMSTVAGRRDEHQHGAYWGVAYSQAYRALFIPWELNRLPDLPKSEDSEK